MNECKPLAGGVLRHGSAVQVDPIKPTLKPPGTKRLKLKYDKLLSMLLDFCFQIQLAALHHGRSAPRGGLPRHHRAP